MTPEEETAARQKALEEGITARQKELDEAPLRRQREIEEGIAARQKELLEEPQRRQKETDEGIASRQKELDEAPGRRQKQINDAIVNRQRELDEAPRRRQKEIEEGIAARQRQLIEGPKMVQYQMDLGIALRAHQLWEAGGRVGEEPLIPQPPTEELSSESTTKGTAEKQQQEVEQARQEGLIGPEPTAQQVAEARRAESKGEVPQPSSPPIAPDPLATHVLSTPTPPIGIPTLSASRWNQAEETTEGGFIPLTFEQSVAKGGIAPHGRIANRAPSRGFTHPFQMQPFWDSELALTSEEQHNLKRSTGAWCCNVIPGFVNGHPPAVWMKRGYLPAGKALSVYGNQYGKKEINDSDTPVQVLLTDDFKPFIKITNFVDSRAKVYGAHGVVQSGEVPLFFRVQGAFKATPLDQSDLDNNALIAASLSERLAFRILGGQPLVFAEPKEADNLPEGDRYCYRADIVLQVDRPALKQNFEFDDISILRLTGFDIKLPGRDKYGARLYTIGIYVPPDAPDLQDVISGAYNEINFDEIVVATLWFLSPSKQVLDSIVDDNGNIAPPIPDGSWLSWTRGEIYWNLNYGSITQIDPVKVDTSLDYFKQILGILAGGAAILIAYSYVNPIEAEYNKILTALNQSIVRGAFWTG